MGAPLFSIITVAYNAEATIGRTVRSVGEQTCRLFEYIVIDGGSADRTVEIAKQAAAEHLIVVSEPDKGIYDAMNKGRNRAKGEYLIFLNAGDTFHSPDTLQHLADVIMDNDFPGVVYGQTDIVDGDGRKVADRHLRAPEVLTYESFKEGMVVCHQAFVALRTLTTPYDTRYKFSADYDWCIRCLQHSRCNVYVDEVLIDYLNEGMTTRHRRQSLRERFRIMSTYFGFFPTLGRHLRFIPRYLRRRKIEKSF